MYAWHVNGSKFKITCESAGLSGSPPLKLCVTALQCIMLVSLAV